MASGKTHSRVALVIAAGGALLAAIKGWPVEPVVVGLIAGWGMTPDLDQEATTGEERRIRAIPLIGVPISIAWQTLWTPYSLAIPHRAPISHWPLLGTAGRAAYIALWLLAIELMAGACGSRTIIDWRGLWAYLWPWGFAAWAIQDIGHWVWDYTPILRRT